MDEEEFIKNFGMTREQYAQEFGSLQDPNLGKDATLRQKSVDKVAGTLQNLGFTEYSAYNQANRLLGNVDNPLTEGGIGVLDFTPVQIPFAIQEGKRALQEGDYFQGVLGLVGSGLEMLPAAKLFTTPVKNFFKNLGNKISTNETIDQSRRSAMTKIAAAPIAVGALSEVPVEKIVDEFDFIDEVDKLPITKKAVGAVVKNLGQPSKTSVIGKLMDFTDFGKGPQYGTETMKESVENFSSELNKAKKYFQLKKKTLDEDELDMISTNSDMADYLENLQTEFGYTNDQIIKFIEDTDSTTRKNTKVWETYLEFGGAEGDPEVGKKLGLGDESENWENWYEDDLFEKFYGSNEADITGKTISKAEE